MTKREEMWLMHQVVCNFDISPNTDKAKTVWFYFTSLSENSKIEDINELDYLKYCTVFRKWCYYAANSTPKSSYWAKELSQKLQM